MVLRVLKIEQFDLTDCLDLPKIVSAFHTEFGQIIKVRVKFSG